MKKILACATILCFLSGCTLLRSFYVRNFLDEAAIIEVVLLNAVKKPDLPENVSTADKVVSFRPHFRNAFKSFENLNWKSPSNFTITLKPKSSADISHLVSRAMKSTGGDMNYIAIIRTRKRIDTLFSEAGDIDRFRDRAVAFLDYVSYYDIR